MGSLTLASVEHSRLNRKKINLSKMPQNSRQHLENNKIGSKGFSFNGSTGSHSNSWTSDSRSSSSSMSRCSSFLNNYQMKDSFLHSDLAYRVLKISEKNQ